ncbi:CPBP family intramembrane metalloprotease [Erysipelothrix sp. HDW6C]|uniref:CPBP family intramembrane glutamic endopeptidase n=1 Tax=Erysipelothrix sp. HDW6C TaxID=2714930 RepID=UPI00140D49EB|nr:CPBP family intramembrane glutamic endopeptidase [Erysipelothrix sp. HDW6C]QIK68800.1 CPBP family intramembrane metalloprotease [Erysipelothrix sp. HDW6C]
MENTRSNKAIQLFIGTIVVGTIYQIFGTLRLSGSLLVILETFWNLIIGGFVAYVLFKETFIDQFKHFSFKTLLLGIPAVFAVGTGFGLVYKTIFGAATVNSIAASISPLMVFGQVPFMLMGEEILSTNIVIAMEKKGFSFMIASLVSSVLFALWHVTAYGFNIPQLLITIVPTRLALNYIWKHSKSIWVSWICHFTFDLIGFIPFLIK